MRVRRGYILCPEYPLEKFDDEESAAQFAAKQLGGIVTVRRMQRAIRECFGIRGLHFYRVMVGDPVVIPKFKDPAGSYIIAEASLVTDVPRQRRPVRRLDTGQVYPTAQYAARVIMSRGGLLLKSNATGVSAMAHCLARAIERGETIDATRWEWADDVPDSFFPNHRAAPVKRVDEHGTETFYTSADDAASRTGVPFYTIRYRIKNGGRDKHGWTWHRVEEPELIQAGVAA